MEKFEELIRLCQQRERTLGHSKQVLSVHALREILKLSEKLNVIAVYDNDGQIEVQLSSLKYLLLLDRNPTKEVSEDILDSAYVWINYKTEMNGIVFFDLESELKEEHKKTQAI